MTVSPSSSFYCSPALAPLAGLTGCWSSLVNLHVLKYRAFSVLTLPGLDRLMREILLKFSFLLTDQFIKQKLSLVFTSQVCHSSAHKIFLDLVISSGSRE